jgi:putative ABC transport system permease protein
MEGLLRARFVLPASTVPIARRNLLAEKGRLTISVGGVAFAVLLILIVLSLYRGWSDVGKSIARLPGDLWVTQPGTSGLYNSSSVLPETTVAATSDLPDVQLVLPVYAREMALDEENVDVFFMALDAPAGVTLPADARERYFPEPGHTYIDNVFAQKAGLGEGDTIQVLDRELVIDKVANLGNAAITQFAFLSAEDARSIFGLPGYVNFLLVSVREGRDPGVTAAEIEAAVPGVEARTSEDFAGHVGKVVNQGFLPVVGVLVGIGFVVGGAVIALTTYTATIEKSRDFGVLKALGASGPFVYRIVITQSLIVGILGFAAGAIAASLAAAFIRRGIPEFITDLRVTDAAVVFGAALLMSFLASYVPVRRINSIDPAMVFRA